MSIWAFLLNAACALLLYFGNGLLGWLKSRAKGVFDYPEFNFSHISTDNFADQFFQKIVHPAIFLGIVAAVLQYFSMEAAAAELWLVLPLFWLLRLLHILLWDLSPFTNWGYEIASMLLSVLLGEGAVFLFIRPLIAQQMPIFIPATQFRDAFWFAAMAYIAKRCWDVAKLTLYGYRVFPANKRSRTIRRRYDRLRWRYEAQLDYEINRTCAFPNGEVRRRFQTLLFAIMIYEDHCRPWAIRLAEYGRKLIFWRAEMSLGIMQVKTRKLIGSRQSICLAVRKVYDTLPPDKASIDLRETCWDYNPSVDYYQNVSTIYWELCQLLGLEAGEGVLI